MHGGLIESKGRGEKYTLSIACPRMFEIYAHRVHYVTCESFGAKQDSNQVVYAERAFSNTGLLKTWIGVKISCSKNSTKINSIKVMVHVLPLFILDLLHHHVKAVGHPLLFSPFRSIDRKDVYTATQFKRAKTTSYIS